MSMMITGAAAEESRALALRINPDATLVLLELVANSISCV